MLSFQQDSAIVLDASGEVRAVAFHPDGKHILGGGRGGIRRWRLEDGQEVGRQAEMWLQAISVSMDHRWIVCGTNEGASVWDAEMQKKVVDVEGEGVMTVDVSPDSTTFATGTGRVRPATWADMTASVWSLTTGRRLVGPLWHGNDVTAVRFSPNGMRIATTCWEGSIRVFDSRNGNELITIETVTPTIGLSTPIAWSNDSGQIFSALKHFRIKLFDVSTGSQVAKSLTFNGGILGSIALAANEKFVVVPAGRFISFLNTPTLSRIDPIIEGSSDILSVALSPDSGYLATGQQDGKIIIRDLGGILPDVYGPFPVSICLFKMLACQRSFILSPILTHYIRYLVARQDNQTSSLQPHCLTPR